MTGPLTVELNSEQAQFLFQALSRYESAQLDRSEKLSPVERSDASINESLQVALELMKKLSSPNRIFNDLVIPVATARQAISSQSHLGSHAHKRTCEPRW